LNLITHSTVVTSLTKHSLFNANSNSIGNFLHKDSSPSHGSNQKLINLPLFNSYDHLGKYIGLIFIKPFQQGESFSLDLIKQIGVSWTYFILTISCHNPFSFSSIHHHLQSKLIFIFLKFFIPRPLFSIIVNHFPFNQVVLLFLTSTLPEKFPSLFI
jgi:hypothetical protein